MIRLLSLCASVIAVVVLAAGFALAIWPEVPPQPAAVSGVSPATRPAMSAEDLMALRARESAEASDVLKGRLLFAPGRAPGPKAETDLSKIQSSGPPPFALRGTITMEGQRMALIVDPAKSEMVMAGAGTTLSGGWTVNTVDHGEIVLARGGRKTVLPMVEMDAEPGAITAAGPSAFVIKDGAPAPDEDVLPEGKLFNWTED